VIDRRYPLDEIIAATRYVESDQLPTRFSFPQRATPAP